MKEIEKFCNEIKAVKYFSNDEAALKKLEVEYEIFGTRNAARDAAGEAAWIAAWEAARNAAWEAARNAAWEAARNAAWNAVWEAAWEAAREAAWGAAWDAVHGAAWNATWDAAWDVARDAALQCCMTTVCKDLDILQEHRDYAAQVWEIWKAGYRVLGKVENVFYIYEKP